MNVNDDRDYNAEYESLERQAYIWHIQNIDGDMRQAKFDKKFMGLLGSFTCVASLWMASEMFNYEASNMDSISSDITIACASEGFAKRVENMDDWMHLLEGGGVSLSRSKMETCFDEKATQFMMEEDERVSDNKMLGYVFGGLSLVSFFTLRSGWRRWTKYIEACEQNIAQLELESGFANERDFLDRQQELDPEVLNLLEP